MSACVVIGGSAGIGFETARRARAEVFDVADPEALKQFSAQIHTHATLL